MRKILNSVKKFLASPKTRAVALMLLVGGTAAFAQSTAGDYTAGTNALTISVYIAMNNEEQDVKKKIMMVVGACIFLVAAAQALPLFFGL